jgi:hypothetical protein
MSEPERGRTVYVTSDGSQWLAIEYPFGLVTPPTIELHRPLQGAVAFYHASAYKLPIPPEATP